MFGYTSPITEGDSLILSCDCHISGISIQWIFSPNANISIPISQSQNVTKENVTTSDSGKYICEVFDEGNVGSAAIVIEVLPDTTVRPTTAVTVTLETTDDANMTTVAMETRAGSELPNIIFAVVLAGGQVLIVGIAIMRVVIKAARNSR